MDEPKHERRKPDETKGKKTMENLEDLENYFVGILNDLKTSGSVKTWQKIEAIKNYKLRINCRKYFFEIGGRHEK